MNRTLDIFGSFKGATGYDNVVRGFASNLQRHGIRPKLQNFDQWSPSRVPYDSAFDQMVGAIGSSSALLNFCLPNQAQYNDHQFCANYTMIETDKVNDEWKLAAGSMDLVMVPSASSKQAFINAGVRDSLIEIAPIGIDESKYNISVAPAVLRDDRLTALEKFYPIRVMNIQELGPRKNLAGLLEAWIVATSQGPMQFASCLILKLAAFTPSRYYKFLQILSEVRDKLGFTDKDHAPIYATAWMMNDGQMTHYMAGATHYLSMSKGEGWDLPAMQAAALGKVMIVPDHSSYADWAVDVGCHHLLRQHKKQEAHADGKSLDAVYAGSSWQVPDVDEAASVIRGLYDTVDSDSKKGPEISARLLSKYSWKKVSKQLVDVLDRRFWKKRALSLVGEPVSAYQEDALDKKGINYWTKNYGKKCGIADYTFSIATALKKLGANVSITGGHSRFHNYAVSVNRFCVENIELEYGFCSPFRLGMMMDENAARGVRTAVTLHTFNEQAFAHNSVVFKKADAIFVHSEGVVSAIESSMLPTDSVYVVPMPMPAMISDEEKKKIDYFKIDGAGRTVVGFFGLMYFHKGIEKLVRAFGEYKKRDKDALLLIVASKPDNTNDDVAGRTLEAMKEYGLEASRDYVWLSHHIKDEREVVATLSQCDGIVLPYDDYGGRGSSAAVGTCLASLRPVLTSSVCWFDHVRDVVDQYDGELSADALDCFVNRAKQQGDLIKQKTMSFMRKSSADEVAKVHLRIYSELVGADLCR